MKIMAIETSCDETSVAIIEVNEESKHVKVRSHSTNSQVEKHIPYGGVYPNLAKREHENNLPQIIDFTLAESGYIKQSIRSEISKKTLGEIKEIAERYSDESLKGLLDVLTMFPRPDIDYLCVTSGPGLEPALWVGVTFAKIIATYWDIPLIPINHMEGHLVSATIQQSDEFPLTTPPFPHLALLVSGGHTELIIAQQWNEYNKIGQTRDDALGEAFDKLGRMLGFPYPGGIMVEKYSRIFAEKKNGEDSPITFTPPMLHTDDYDFSFSGLKTAARRIIEENTEDDSSDGNKLPDTLKESICYAYEQAAFAALEKKTMRAVANFGIQSMSISGGVANNKNLTSRITDALHTYNPNIVCTTPMRSAMTDNALMIAVAGYYRITEYLNTGIPFPDMNTISANGRWSLGD